MQSGKKLKWIGSDWFWVSLLALLGCLTRIPFAGKTLFHWDSINFALAIDKFNISLHQPQPPGYLLFVLLTRIVNVFFSDSQMTFIFMSIVFSILASVALYLLGKTMFNARVGLVSGLLFLFSPMFWFYSDISLPSRIIDAFLVTLIAFYFYKTSIGETKYVWIAAVLLGLSGGFRQQTLLFMAPLAVYAVRRLKFSTMILSGACAVIVFLLSFIPMVMVSGGLAQYTAAVNALSDSAFAQTSIFRGGGFAAIKRNGAKLVAFTAYALIPAGISILAWIGLHFRKIPALFRTHRAWFLLFWLLPSVLFYTFIHMGSHGLIFVYLPALFLLTALGLVDLVDSMTRNEENRRKWIAAIVSVFCLISTLVFTLTPSTISLGNTSITIVNLQTIRENDTFYLDRLSEIKGFNPQNTIILASKWRHTQYYLPEFQVFSALCEDNVEEGFVGEIYSVRDRKYVVYPGGDISNEMGEKPVTLVFFDQDSLCVLDDASRAKVERIPMPPNGDGIYILRLADAETIDYHVGRLVINAP
jgi:hypothetical protein